MTSRGSLATEAANNQQQISTQEFMTSRGSSHTRYLIATCSFMQIYINVLYESYQPLERIYFIDG